MTKTYPLFACGLAALVSMVPAAAAGQDSPADEPQVPALFASHDLIEFTIETDYGALRGDREQDSEYRPAVLRMIDDTGAERAIDIRVRTRGRFRLENCRFPPLRVNFPRNSMGGTVFDGQNGIRLVSHCRDRDDDEQNVLEEYLVYRTYNLLTDNSMRVRLARVTYADPDEDEPVVRYAFFREEAEAMAERLGATYVEIPYANPRGYNTEAAVRFSIFQYMMGNTDWSMVEFHNAEVFTSSTGVAFPVPYDFDWTGFVNARYAVPNEGLRIRNVRQRIYRGFCRPEFDFTPVYQQFLDVRPEVEALYRGQEGLDEDNLEDALDYIADFYEDIESESNRRNRIERDCRSM